MKPETITAIRDQALPKGDVLTVANVAGILAAKRTAELIPMCHPLNLAYVDIQFELQDDRIEVKATAKTKEATGIEMEAYTAVSVACLTIVDICKSADMSLKITDIELLKKTGGKSSHKTDYRPKTGIIVLSDTISKEPEKDKSGKILTEGFQESGCKVSHFTILPDEPNGLLETLNAWLSDGVELIVTSGGTGVGPRDITIETLEKCLTRKLPGIEQALQSYGREKLKTAMLSRLMAGTINNSILICIPGSSGAARDALAVLIPTVFHAFHMIRGESHEPLKTNPNAS
jgi:molybdenum cofactor biosynthesis protein MoaC